MKINQVIALFGSQSEIARQLNLSRQYVCRWVKNGKIPIVWQFKIQKLTKNALLADTDDI